MQYSQGSSNGKQGSNGDSPTQSPAVSFTFEQKEPERKAALFDWINRSYITILSLLLVLSLLYWVFVLLPEKVPQIAPASLPETQQTTTPQLIEQAPWQDAQLAQKRREAQDVLATLLSKQQELQDKRVDIWGDAAYQEAVKQAENGDLLYRQQQFEQAISAYNLAVSQLDALVATVPEHFNGYLQRGLVALEAYDAQLAKEQLTIALYLDSQSDEAGRAFDRSLVLDKVMALIKSGIADVDEQRLEAATVKFSDALALDSNSILAKTHLDQTAHAIKQRDYAKAMSNGYNKLNSKQYATAIKHFKRAQKIFPDNSAPAQAIAQSRNLTTQSKLDIIIADAQSLEHQEQWFEAHQKYLQALQVDNSLLDAKLGQLRTQARDNLSKQLNKIITQPLRLTDERIYQESKKIYSDALKTKSPGNKLRKQLELVKTTLTHARVPVSLQIESNNHTQVTLYKVGTLGQFATKKINLNPGVYTIVGSRDGYQDVRQQFTLNANAPTTTITVKCDQRVTNG